MRNAIRKIVEGILPHDDMELEHQKDVLSWVDSGEPIFRIESPDVPPKHLVSYFIVYDSSSQKILLGDHRKSGLWLPSGGHVDPDEHPKDTVKRECQEELREESQFFLEQPLFVTVTGTVGLTAGHTDVSLWYVLLGDASKIPDFDSREYNKMAWFPLDELPLAQSDPHLGRFAEKLRSI